MARDAFRHMQVLIMQKTCSERCIPSHSMLFSSPVASGTYLVRVPTAPHTINPPKHFPPHCFSPKSSSPPFWSQGRADILILKWETNKEPPLCFISPAIWKWESEPWSLICCVLDPSLMVSSYPCCNRDKKFPSKTESWSVGR